MPRDNAGEAALVGRPGRDPGRHRARACRVPAWRGPPAAERLDPAAGCGRSIRGRGLRSTARPPGAEARARGRRRRQSQRADDGSAGSGKSMAARRLPSIMPPLSLGMRWRRRASTASPACSALRRSCSAGHFARRTIRSPPRASSAVAARRPQARPASRSTASCSSTSFRSSHGRRSRHCANRSRRAACGSRGRNARSAFRHVSCSPPQPIRVRAATRATLGVNAAATHRWRPAIGRAQRTAAGPDRHDPARRAAACQGRDGRGGARGVRTIRERVLAARAVQERRLRGSPAACNAHMTHAQLRRAANLEPAARAALHDAHERAGLTMRGHDRVLRVARTLADLEGSGASFAATSHRPSPIESLRPCWMLRRWYLDVTACDRCLRRTARSSCWPPGWSGQGRQPASPAGGARSPGRRAHQGALRHQARGGRPAAGRFDPARARVRAQAAGIEVVCRHAPRYPPVLAGRVGCARGAPPDRQRRYARACGRRPPWRSSAPGALRLREEIARSLGRDLAACDVPVVSGMAYGIDSAAHEGALAAGGRPSP